MINMLLYSKDLYSPSLHQSCMAASSDYPEVMKATSLDNSQVHSFLFLVTKSYTLFMNVILCLCC